MEFHQTTLCFRYYPVHALEPKPKTLNPKPFTPWSSMYVDWPTPHLHCHQHEYAQALVGNIPVPYT